MYYPLLTSSSFFLVLLILVYRNRKFFASFLPTSFQSRLPEFLKPDTSPSLPLPVSVPWTRRFLPSNRGYTPLSSNANANNGFGFDWQSNLRNGLNSSLFNIETNVNNRDSRIGLDPTGAQDVQTIMNTQNVSFDQARLIRHKQILKLNNIDPNTGMPLDSKAVTSLGGHQPGSSRG